MPLQTFIAGLKEIVESGHLGSILKFWLGLLAFVVALLWPLLYLTPLFSSCTLFGFQGVLCTLGQVGLAAASVCWLITAFLLVSILSVL